MASSKPKNPNDAGDAGPAPEAGPALLRRQASTRQEKALWPGAEPLSIDWGEGETRTRVTFADGSVVAGSCIHCVAPPCIEYRSEELKVVGFEQFPADLDTLVCPTNAIQWPAGASSPVVDEEACISCGLCVTRCPAGAIHLDASGAHVYDAPNSGFVETGRIVEEASNLALQDQLAALPRSGQFLPPAFDPSLENLTQNVVTLSSRAPQLPNRFARNLLLALGVSAAMRRLGDVNLRMDLVLGPPGVEQGTGEVEIGTEVLNTPRNLLDSVAVLCHRYGFAKEEILPLIVTSRLPNRRTEYWRVIADISKVLDMRIRSLTFGAMVLLVWNQKRLDFSNAALFYADDQSHSIRADMEKLLGRNLESSDELAGLFEVAK